MQWLEERYRAISPTGELRGPRRMSASSPEGSSCDDAVPLLRDTGKPTEMTAMSHPPTAPTHVYVSRQDVSDGHLAIHYLAESGPIDLLRQELTREPGCANLCTKSGWTPMHFAAWRGRLDAVQLLYELGNANPDTEDKWGVTPLQCAALNNHADVCRYLVVKCKCDPRLSPATAVTVAPGIKTLLRQLGEAAQQ